MTEMQRCANLSFSNDASQYCFWLTLEWNPTLPIKSVTVFVVDPEEDIIVEECLVREIFGNSIRLSVSEALLNGHHHLQCFGITQEGEHIAQARERLSSILSNTILLSPAD